jgi:hypothetical protein
MKKFTFILFLIISNFTFGQDSEDQTETYINNFRKELTKKSVYAFFVVKHIQYGGSRITHIKDKDYCEKEEVHYRMYAFWKEDNYYWLKVFDNCGGFAPIKLKDKIAHEFYIENIEKIKLDEVERYKVKADSIANNKRYSFYSIRSHTPLKYFWFYNYSDTFKKFINEYDLTTSKKNRNISYETNRNLALVKLNSTCDAIIEKYVKTESLEREK